MFKPLCSTISQCCASHMSLSSNHSPIAKECMAICLCWTSTSVSMLLPNAVDDAEYLHRPLLVRLLSNYVTWITVARRGCQPASYPSGSKQEDSANHSIRYTS